MPEVRLENEIKMYSSGGPFAYEGDDPGPMTRALVTVIESEGFATSEIQCRRHTDFYYTDTKGDFDRDGILLRYRDTGASAFLTMKLPTVKNGMGLTRREIEGEILNDTRFERWKPVQHYASEVYGPVEIDRVPRLRIDVTRGRCQIRSKIRAYTFTSDRMVYTDPVSGRKSMPCYELEFETLDEAIGDDPQMTRLLALLSGKYLYEEERISKYARGMAFVRSLNP